MSDLYKTILNNIHKELRSKHKKKIKDFHFTAHIEVDNEYKNAKPPFVVVGWSMVESCYFWIEGNELIVRSAQMYYDDPNIEAKIDLQDPTISIVDKLVELLVFYDENCVQEIRENDDCKQAYLNAECGL